MPRETLPLTCLLLTGLLSCALAAPAQSLAGDAPRPGSAADLVRKVKGTKSAAKRAAIVKEIEGLGKKAEGALLGSWKRVDERTAVDLLLLVERLRTESAREDLIKATRHRNLVVRRTAAAGLGGYPHPATEKALFRLVRDREDDVALSAIDAIRTLESKTTFKPLLRALRRYDDDPQGRRFKRLLSVAQGLLASTHDPEIVRTICRLAAMEEGQHQAAILGILEVGETKVCPPILREVLKEFVEGEDYEGPGFEEPLRDATTAEGLRPVTPAFARVAIKGLGLARDQASSQTLIAALSHSSAEVRYSALQFLHLTLPKGPKAMTAEAPQAFPVVRRKAIKAVMTRLTDRSTGVRQRAYVWLKRETKQKKLPPTFAAWKGWYETYFGDQEEWEYE